MFNKQRVIEKKKGQVYTPEFVVCNMLDLIDYKNSSILEKNIIDNSCGNGAFLKEIVSRYCSIALENNVSRKKIKEDLERYIHGIDLDETECFICRKALDCISARYGIFDVRWDIVCGDTLSVKKYDNSMDFVVGNPPYVRVHNLDDIIDKVKTFQFSKNGMTDLFIVFFEIGLHMLNKNGVMCYISPSSYFTSNSGKVMRSYFVKNSLLSDLVDLEHSKIFNASTYTCITVLRKNIRQNFVNYYKYDLKNKKIYFEERLEPNDYMIGNCFYFAKKEKLNKLKSILFYNPILSGDTIDVKNGFATLCDDFFIKDKFPFSSYVIPVIKSSTGELKQCFFPYDEFGNLISYNTLISNDIIKKYYSLNLNFLKNRSLENEENWWGFGRTQAIKDVSKNKYSVNSLVKDVKDIKLMKCERGVGVYSGLYILTNVDFERIQNVLKSNDFIDYVSLLGKYKSGGYYTFSSKDLKKYLEYQCLRKGNYE